MCPKQRRLVLASVQQLLLLPIHMVSARRLYLDVRLFVDFSIDYFDEDDDA